MSFRVSHVLRLVPVLAIVCGGALAHEDDPKLLGLLPGYQGPGYRADFGGEAPRGFPSNNMTLLSWLPLSEFGSHDNGNDCWGYVSPSGREYALMGLSGGTGFVEITNPGNAQLIDMISGPTSLWRDIKTYQNYAYVVSEGGGGIQVFDLSQIDNGVVTLVNTVTTGGSTATHNVAIDTDSGFLYRCGGGGNGIRIYSLANPANPTFVASWSTRYVHDAQIVTYTSGPYAGRQIAFLCSGDNGGWDNTGLEILDVTNKSNIVQLSRRFWPNPGYSHQGWLSPDRNYFYMGDELDEQSYGLSTTTHVFDVSDLSNPVRLGAFSNGQSATGHNMYTVNNLIFQANYTSGLRVFDATDPNNVAEIAYFDTAPSSSSNGFNGLWSTYPYFPSGTVIGSDMQNGLFVLRLGTTRLEFSYPNGLPTLLDPSGQTVRVAIEGVGGAVLEPGTAQMFYDIGQGFVPVALVPAGGSEFDAFFPALACETPVGFYFQAEDDSGLIWTDPPNAPGGLHQAVAATDQEVVFADDMEIDRGWAAGAAGDTATTGVWERVNPRGTAAQPEDDHTVSGTICWVTGQGPAGGGVGDNDVDNGRTTLLSPVLDLTGQDGAYISYWRWYSNDQGAAPNADVFRIDVTNNGTNWVNVETIGPSGPGTSGGWFYHEFRVSDFVAPSSQVRMRFIAEDAGDGSIVEAAVDDFDVRVVSCQADCPEDLTGDGLVDFDDLVTLLGAYGVSDAGDITGDGQTNFDDLVALLAAYGTSCP